MVSKDVMRVCVLVGDIAEGYECNFKFLSAELESLCRRDKPFSVDVLWFADVSVEPCAEMLREFSLDVQIHFTGPLLQASLKSFGEQLSSMYEELAGFLGEDYFWLMSVSEINFARELPLNLLRYKIIADFVEKHDFETVIAQGSEQFERLVRAAAGDCDLRINRSGRHNYWNSGNRPFFYFAKLWGWNFLNDLFGCFALSKSKRSISVFKTVVFSPFPRHWKCRSDGRLCNRFYGPVSEVYEDTLFLLTLSRNNKSSISDGLTMKASSDRLSKQGIGNPHLIIESYGSISSIFSSYFNFVQVARVLWRVRSFRMSLCRRGRPGFMNLYRDHLLLGVLVDLPKNTYFISCLRRLAKELEAGQIVIPFFEFVEGRAVVKALSERRFRTVGLEHGTNGEVHAWRVSLPLSIMNKRGGVSTSFKPHEILLEGRHSASRYANAGLDSVKVIRSYRLSFDQATRIRALDRDTIVMLCDMHNPTIGVRQLIGVCNRLGVQLIIRPHPSSYEYMQKWVAELSVRSYSSLVLDTDGKDIYRFLEQAKPFAAVVGVSGAVIDLARAGVPFVLIGSNWVPNYSVFADGIGISSVMHEEAEIYSELHRLMTDDGYRDTFINEAAEKVAQIVEI